LLIIQIGKTKAFKKRQFALVVPEAKDYMLITDKPSLQRNAEKFFVSVRHAGFFKKFWLRHPAAKTAKNYGIDGAKFWGTVVCLRNKKTRTDVYDVKAEQVSKDYLTRTTASS